MSLEIETVCHVEPFEHMADWQLFKEWKDYTLLSTSIDNRLQLENIQSFLVLHRLLSPDRKSVV